MKMESGNGSDGANAGTGLFGGEDNYAPSVPTNNNSGAASLEQTVQERHFSQPRSEYRLTNEELEQRQGDLKFSRENIDKLEQMYTPGIREQSFEDKVANLDKDIRSTLGEINGVRKTVYNTAKVFGLNLYRRDVIKAKDKLEHKIEHLQSTINVYERLLENPGDNGSSRKSSQKGLRTHINDLSQLCRGLYQHVVALDAMHKGIEKKQVEFGVQIEDYKEKIKNDPDNTQLGTDLRYLVGKSNELAQDGKKTHVEKRKYQTRLVRSDRLLETHKGLEKSYEAHIDVGKESINRAMSALALVNMYLDNCDGYKSLLDFQKEIKTVNEGVGMMDTISDKTGDVILGGIYALDDEVSGSLSDIRDGSKIVENIAKWDDERLAKQYENIEKVMTKYAT